MLPSSALLEQLSTSRFLISSAQPSVGVGERRSKAKGAGLEFAEHRQYYSGDDVKHLDQRLLARLGENFIRQYSVDRQLPITLLLDASGSMQHGTPNKFEFTRQLAQLLSFVGLAGGDRVQLVVARDGKLHWSPRVHGVGRAEILGGWLAQQVTHGGGSFNTALQLVRKEIRPAGLLILISDWWFEEDFIRELRALREDHQEVIAFQVASPDEADPGRLGSGPHYLVDVETGEEVEIALGPDAVKRYLAAYDERRAKLSDTFNSQQSRFIEVSTDADLGTLFLRQLRMTGVIT